MVLSTDNNELSRTAAGQVGSQLSPPVLSVRDLRTWFDTPVSFSGTLRDKEDVILTRFQIAY